MSVEVRDNIYSDIASQFPAVYREHSDIFVGFLESYYEHLDEELDRDLPKIGDIDTTLNKFLVYYKKKYLSGLPFESEVDVRFILKHIRDLYTRKGNEESLKLIFKMFFNENIEIKYPSLNVLRASDSLWGGEEFLEMKSIYDVDGYPIQRGNTIRGDLSSASAFVDDIVFVNIKGSVVPIVYLSNLRGKFTVNDSLEVISADNDNIETIVNVGKLINGSISNVDVSNQNRLPSNRVGDLIELRSLKNGVGANGVVSEISAEAIGSIDYEIIDGGFGYIKPGTSPSIEFYNDIGISNRVIILKESIRLDVTPGDLLVFPGSTVDHDGRTSTSEQYSVNGAARIIAYRHPLLFVETRSTREDIFKFLSGTYRTNTGAYRNIIYDNYYNALSRFINPTAVRPFDVPNILTQVTKDIYFKLEDDDGGIIGSFTGVTEDGDLSTLSTKVSDIDFEFLFKYMQSVNNGINDAELINNIDVIEGLIETSGQNLETFPDLRFVGTVTQTELSAETPDRTPTIAPVPAGPGGSDGGLGELFNTLSLADLKHGQHYTIVTPGTTLTDADWKKIGAAKGVSGTDFVFSNADIDTLTIEGNVTTDATTLARHDCIFSVAKQVFARMYRFLDQVDLVPQLTIGASFETPPEYPDVTDHAFPHPDNTGTTENPDPDDIVAGNPHPKRGTPNYEYYDAYHVPVAPTNVSNQVYSTTIKTNLLPSREYLLFDLGDTSYSEWVALGLPLDTAPEITIIADPNPSDGVDEAVVTGIVPRRTYFIKDVGALSPNLWNALGWSGATEDAVPLLGDKFIASYPLPDISSVTATFEAADINGTVDSDALFDLPEELYHSIKIIGHDFDTRDKVVFSPGSGVIGLANLVDALSGGDYYIKKLDDDHVQLYTSYDLLSNELVEFQNNNTLSSGHTLTRNYGSPKVVDAFPFYDISNKFTPNPESSLASEITGSGVVIDLLKVDSSTATNVNFITQQVDNNGLISNVNNTVPVNLGLYNVEGLMTDPIVTPAGTESDRLPITGIGTNPEFIGLINGKASRPVHCVGIGPFNDSTSFDISATDNDETVTIITDLLYDIELETIGNVNATDAFQDGQYDLSGETIETVDTEYRDAFTKYTFTLGSISELKEDNPGTDYENDVGVNIVNEAIARFNKKNYIVNFDTSDFTLTEGEIVEQEIIIEDQSIDTINSLSKDAVADIPPTVPDLDPLAPQYGISATTFELKDEFYTVKAEFMKREEEDFYFRHKSFYDFDENVPVRIRAKDRNITRIRIDEDSLPMGANAVIAGPAFYDTGQIKSIAVTHTGYKFSDGEVINIVNTMPESPRFEKVVGSAQVRTLGQGNTLGRWKSRNSFLSEKETRIHDNDYYQEYSYDISSMIDPEIYTPLVKDVVGVTGTKMFSTPLINSDNILGSNVDADVVRFAVNTSILRSESTLQGEQIQVVDSTIENKDFVTDAERVITATGISNDVVTSANHGLFDGDIVRVSDSGQSNPALVAGSYTVSSSQDDVNLFTLTGLGTAVSMTNVTIINVDDNIAENDERLVAITVTKVSEGQEE